MSQKAPTLVLSDAPRIFLKPEKFLQYFFPSDSVMLAVHVTCPLVQHVLPLIHHAGPANATPRVLPQ